MNWQELQQQSLQLSVEYRWHLLQSILTSIRQETFISNISSSNTKNQDEFEPWTQILIGAIHSNGENFTESYIDYLEEKYS
jgi:hypothetical protein